MRSISSSSERSSIMVVMRSFLVQTLCRLEDTPNVSIEETLEGFDVKGPGYELNVTEQPASYVYKDAGVEITMEKRSKAIVCYEMKNCSRTEQLNILRQSETGVARELLSKLPGNMNALAFTEDLGDAVRLVEEQIQYRNKK